MNEITPLLDDNSTISRHRPLDRLAEANRGSLLPESAATSTVSRSFQESSDEFPLGEVVQALFSAWQRTRKPKTEVTLDFFTSRELYEMHKAWKEITRGKYFNPVDQNIAECLAEAIATEITPIFPFPPEHLYFKTWILAVYADKNLLAVNLLREWGRITGGDDADFLFLEDSDNDNQSHGKFQRIHGLWQRSAQLRDTICCLIFNIKFKFLLHSLLIVWPLSILIVATTYLDCSVNLSLLYLLLILGVIGCCAIVIRLMLIFSTGRNLDPEELYWRWMSLRFIELCFLIVFIMQAHIVFDIRPPTEPISDQCVGKFYSAVLRTTYVSIALLSVYLIVYANKIHLRFFNSCW